MRFVWAVVAFILATVLIGAGIAQRTMFLGPSEQRMQVTVEDPQPYLLIDGAVLRANSGLQTLMIRGKGDIFAAYGRTSDLKAWLADAAYDDVSLSKKGKPQVKVVEASVPSDSETARNPDGSDLWLDSFRDKDSLITEMQLPEGMSMLVARDG
ncbi:MAG: glycosyl transferase, partial [Microbacterium sp.]